MSALAHKALVVCGGCLAWRGRQRSAFGIKENSTATIGCIVNCDSLCMWRYLARCVKICEEMWSLYESVQRCLRSVDCTAGWVFDFQGHNQYKTSMVLIFSLCYRILWTATGLAWRQISAHEQVSTTKGAGSLQYWQSFHHCILHSETQEPSPSLSA
jgi:hypothetical protein